MILKPLRNLNPQGILLLSLLIKLKREQASPRHIPLKLERRIAQITRMKQLFHHKLN
jgi:hypothetical protein